MEKRTRVGLGLLYCPLLVHYHMGCPGFPRGVHKLVKEAKSLGLHFPRQQIRYQLVVFMCIIILISLMSNLFLIWKGCWPGFYFCFHPRKSNSISFYFSIFRIIYQQKCTMGSVFLCLYQLSPSQMCPSLKNVWHQKAGGEHNRDFLWVCRGRQFSPVRCTWP